MHRARGVPAWAIRQSRRQKHDMKITKSAPPPAPIPAPAHPVTGPAQVGQAPQAPGSSPAPQDRGLALPHERDESTGAADDPPREVIKQAARDLERGLVDTDMRATPGLDAERRRRLVPGPGGAPPGTAAQD